MGAHGSFADLPAEEPYDGLRRRSFDGERATVNEYVFEPYSRFPLHRHPQEQITLVEEGDIELTVSGDMIALRAGDWSVLQPNVEHGIRAGRRGARIIAILVPRRSSSTAYEVLE
jgi:quercetin dioxygenase-like cupin family protein